MLLIQPSVPNINTVNKVSIASEDRNALGIESDEVVNYTFLKHWPADREVRARIIGEWLQTEARYLA